MAKDARDRVVVGKKSSKGEHGGNRAGDADKKKGEARKQSDPAAGKDPHRGNR